LNLGGAVISQYLEKFIEINEIKKAAIAESEAGLIYRIQSLTRLFPP
jgi:hypothetical protein